MTVQVLETLFRERQYTLLHINYFIYSSIVVIIIIIIITIIIIIIIIIDLLFIITIFSSWTSFLWHEK